MKSKQTILVLASFACGLSGCGGIEQYPVAVVTGRVTCQGKPVPHAMVFFEPLASGQSAMTGKQGFGECNEKGEFIISTYSDKDGAVIGKHWVHVMPPHSEDHPGFKCPCEFNSATKRIEVTVNENGKNNYDFALPVGTSKDKNLSLDEIEAMEEAKINQASGKK